jgi:hypothetical protein
MSGLTTTTTMTRRSSLAGQAKNEDPRSEIIDHAIKAASSDWKEVLPMPQLISEGKYDEADRRVSVQRARGSVQ